MSTALPYGVYGREGPRSLKDDLAKLLVLIVIVGPFLGILLACWQWWDKGIGWRQLLMLFGTYIPIAWLGVTLGFHRYLTHRGFKATLFIRVLLVLLAELAILGPVIKWVAEHLRHHMFSDGPGDPHSPMGHIEGLPHAHFGWFLSGEWTDPAIYARHIYKDRFIIFMDRLFPLWVAVSIGAPYLFWGWDGLIWGGLVRIFFVHHVTWSINSICHLWGERPYTNINDGVDNSRNVAALALPSGGESFHNNHHQYPGLIKHGTYWWQDPTYWIACILEFLHLISKLNRGRKNKLKLLAA